MQKCGTPKLAAGKQSPLRHNRSMTNDDHKTTLVPGTPPDTTAIKTAPSPAADPAQSQQGAAPATGPGNPPSKPRPPTRRERLANNPPEFWLSKFDADQPKKQAPPLAEDAIRVEYAIKIQGGTEVILDVASQFDLPLALREECLTQTDAGFAQILDTVVVAPVLTQVRAYLQRRFEGYAAIKAKQATPLLMHPNSTRVGQQPGGTQVTMPAIESTPPLIKPLNQAA